MRPILRPGTHVLRRDRGTLQVGLHPDRAVVLPDAPEIRACLKLLDNAASADEYVEPRGRDTLRALERSDLLVDSSRLLPLIPSGDPDAAGPVPSPSRADVCTLAAAVGDDVDKLVAARTGCRLVVSSFGPEPDLASSTGPGGRGALASQLTDLASASGLSCTLGAGPGSRSGRRAAAAALVGVGEPERELLDGWVGAGTPHLLVRFTEGFATVGPFVVPGQTACLRCLDAHHTDADPAWPLLVAQYSSRVGRPRPDGVPEPVDPLVATVALAWAARDLATFAEGRRPTTWSATLRLDPRLATVETHTWLRHPECGCSWQ